MSIEYVSFGVAPEDTRAQFEALQPVFENDVGALITSLKDMEGYIYTNEANQYGGLSRQELETWATGFNEKLSKLKSTYSALKATGPVSIASNIYDVASAVNAVATGGSIVEAALNIAKIPATSALTALAVGFASSVIITPVLGVGIIGVVAVGIVAGISNYAASEAWDSVVKYLKQKGPSDNIKVSVNTQDNKAYYLGTNGDDQIYLVDDGANSVVLGLDGKDSIRLARAANGVIIEGGKDNDFIGIQGKATVTIRPGDGIDTILELENTTPTSDIKINFEGDFGLLDSELAIISSPYQRILTVSHPSPGIATTTGVTFLNGGDLEKFRTVSLNGVTRNVRDLTHYVFGSLEGHSETLRPWGGKALVDGQGGEDQIYGAENPWGAQVLIGGRGQDTIYYHDGSLTTLRFNKGDGYDVVYSLTDATASGLIIDLSEIRLDEIDIQGWYDSLKIGYGNTNGITIRDWDRLIQVSEIRLADGVLSDLDIITRATTGTEGEDDKAGTKYNDYIQGFGGDDRLFGNGGDDTLVGGAGQDMLSGGEGSDHYLYSAGWGLDGIQGGSGDQIDFDGSIHYVDLSFRRDASSIYINKGFRDQIRLEDIYKLNYELNLVFSDGYRINTSQIKELLRDDEHITVGEGTEGPVNGGLGNDTIIGSSGNDFIDGGDGADYLAGGMGDDVYVIGSKFDVVNEQKDEGTDTIISSIDINLAFHRNIENIKLIDGALIAHGNELNNFILASTGNQRIYGGAGDDTIQGGAGDDLIQLDSGNNTYIYNVGDGIDQILDQKADTTGLNIIKMGVAFEGVSLSMSGNEFIIRVNAGGGEVRIIDLSTISRFEFADGISLSREELLQHLATEVNGTIQDDTIYGGQNSEIIRSFEGNDSISGSAGNDTLDGGLGDDTLTGGEGSDTFIFGVGSGQDQIQGIDLSSEKLDIVKLGPDVRPEDVRLQRGIEGLDNLALYIRGSSDRLLISNYFSTGYYGDGYGGGYGGNYLPEVIDEIHFSDGTVWGRSTIEAVALRSITEEDDRVYGGAGADTFNGLGGSDYIFGGGSSDVLNGGAGNDELDGGDGNDILDGGAENDQLYGGAGDDILVGGIGSDELYGEDGNDILDSGDDNDQLYGGTGDDTLVGGIGSDELYGEDGNDILDSGADDDQLYGGTGSDTLVGGAGSDELYGNNDNDILDGGAGSDQLYGNNGNDMLDGGADSDQLYGDAGDDTLVGGVGNDELYGGDGNDIIDGGADYNRLYGGTGDDTLVGGIGSDELYGEDGGDILVGGHGDDTLDGGAGGDYLDGGAGSDTYLFGRGSGQDNIRTGGENSDTLLFGEEISADQLWFQRNGSDLVVSVMGGEDTVSVSNWFFDNSYHLKQFKTADGRTLLDTQVQGLVDAMASFGVPVASESNLTANQQAQLAIIVAASWQ